MDLHASVISLESVTTDYTNGSHTQSKCETILSLYAKFPDHLSDRVVRLLFKRKYLYKQITIKICEIILSLYAKFPSFRQCTKIFIQRKISLQTREGNLSRLHSESGRLRQAPGYCYWTHASDAYCVLSQLNV